MSKFVPKKIVPYAAFEQVILVFRPEWLVQSQHMERFFSERIWTKFGQFYKNIKERIKWKDGTQSIVWMRICTSSDKNGWNLYVKKLLDRDWERFSPIRSILTLFCMGSELTDLQITPWIIVIICRTFICRTYELICYRIKDFTTQDIKSNF